MLLETQIAAIVGSVLLLSAFIITHQRYPSAFSWYWVAGWTFYTIRFGLDILSTLFGGSYLLLVGSNAATATSAILLLIAVDRLFGEGKIEDSHILGLWFLLNAWIILSPWFTQDFAIIHTPLYLSFGVIQLGTAYLFYDYLSSTQYSSTPLIVGSMAIWGIHKLDYPFLRPIASIAQYGYALGAVLAFTTGLGVIMFLVEEAESEARNERETAERRFEEYQDLFNNLTDPVYIHELDGRFLNVNETAIDVLGYSKAEFCSLQPRDIVAPEYKEEVENRVSRIANGESISFRSAHETKAGEEIPVEVHATTISFRGEKAALAVARDISAQIQRESRLKEFRRAVQHAGHAVYIADRSGTITYVNPAFSEVTGFSVDEAVGSTPAIMRSGKMSEEYYEELWEAVLDGEVWKEVVINRRKSGDLYHAQQTIAPITNSKGEVSEFVAIQTDISELKERERQLKVIDRILRHNLNNLMTVILGQADRIRRSGQGEIERAATQIKETGETLHELAHKERQIVKLLTEKPDTQLLSLKRVLSSIHNSAVEEYPNATIEIEAKGARQIEAIPHIENAISELVENAVEHNQGETVVEVQCSVEDGMVFVSIVDNGPGIPKEEQAVLTGEAEIDPLTHGSGLGLWMVNHVVKQSNGAVKFDGNENGGSTVTLVLPGASADTLVPAEVN